MRSIRTILGKQAVQRLPATPNASAFATTGLPSPQLYLNSLNAYGAVSWLFATVNRIAHATATVRWSLYEVMANGDRREVFDHPLLRLWKGVSPYETGESFREAGQQHLDLTGEWWTVLLRGRSGLVEEMELVRPDRMYVIPSAQEFIAGYIYRLPGVPDVPLRRDDVMLIKMPNPLDPYRGMGPVQALLVDLESERAAATWTRNFFWNSAEPGGVIQFEETLSDEDFERLVARWQTQHKGVSNAHRVAVLERGQWVDRKLSQRDMQFEQLRRLNRDIIVHAFGMPTALLGVAESVNRANAEAAELMFGRWVIKPRLERIRDAVNERLVPLFGPNLEMDFADPTPADRDRAILEATQGYGGGILTLNEARRRLGEGELPEGNELKPVPTPSPFALGVKGVIKAEGVDLPRELEQEEGRVRRRWAERLESERDAIIAYLSVFVTRTASHPVAKIELADVAGYNWDWWSKYGEEVVLELTRLFVLSVADMGPAIGPGEVQRIAAEYARERGARLLQVTGDLNIAQATRARVNELVARALLEGRPILDSRDEPENLERWLRNDLAFSPERARTVARTETATALGQGQKQAAIAQGRDEKRWVTQGASDPRVDQVCLANEAQGWIPIGHLFQGGVDTVPQHPNCQCKTEYRTSGGAEIDVEEGLAEDIAQAISGARSIDEVRCPKCNTRMPVNHFQGRAAFLCRKRECRAEFSVSTIEEGLEVVRKIVERDDDGRIIAITEERPLRRANG